MRCYTNADGNEQRYKTSKTQVSLAFYKIVNVVEKKLTTYTVCAVVVGKVAIRHSTRCAGRRVRKRPRDGRHNSCHTMDMLWEKFQWILPLYMKPISIQSKASVVCSVTTAVFIEFCLKKLNVFSQHTGKKTNEYLNSTSNRRQGNYWTNDGLMYWRRYASFGLGWLLLGMPQGIGRRFH